MTEGRFITFEGADGVGKTTQIRRLAERLAARGHVCRVTREPGGTPFAERLRALILDPETPEHSPLAEALLFAAARQDHVASAIRPALAAGHFVLSDRFADSTRAYQGAAGGVEGRTLRQLEGIAHPDCMPDLTFVLDLAPEAGRARLLARGDATGAGTPGADRFERREADFQARLRAAFLAIAAEEPERCAVIDAAPSPETVHEAIWSIAARRFGLEAG